MIHPPILPLIIASLVFVVTYLGVLRERIPRMVAALTGAVVMVAFGRWFSFYTPQQAVGAIDFETIALLLGMMIVVGLFKETGFFEYLAVRTTKLAGGRPWLLLICLGLMTSLVSMFLDNVTTIIMMLPVTVSIADILAIPAVPLLMGEAMLSNVGGVATLIGDPPNILIGSAAGFSFTDFLIHLAPIVLVTWIVVQGFLLIAFRRALVRRPANVSRIMAMDASRAIVDRRTTIRMLIVLGVTIILYLVHERLGLGPGMVALIGACMGLVWIWPDVNRVLREVHWDVLIFFVSLFVIVGGLESAGVLDIVADAISGLTAHGMIVASLVVLWAGAIMSAIVDNVPFTITMLPIIAGLASRGLETAPLWWALALGVGFGGNATPIGATANVITMSFSEKTDTPISTRSWLKVGLPAAFLSCVIASAALVVAIPLGLL